MRKILIGVVFVFLIAIGVLDLIFTNQSFNKIEAQVLEIDEVLKEDDYDQALTKVYNLEKTWQEEMSWMQTFIMYSEIKPISEKIARLVSLIELKNDEALIEAGALMIEIKDVHQIYEFSLPNLF